MRQTSDLSSKALDGWRGLAMLFVLACHTVPLPKWLAYDIGLMGMTMFFVLSGFLIGSSLERSASTTQFFVARARRIFPVLWTLLLVMVAIGMLKPSEALVHVAALSNRWNYVWALVPGAEHFWSLAVELHFYFFAGISYAFMGRRFPLTFASLFLAIALAASIHAGGFLPIPNPFRISSCAFGLFLHFVWKRWGRILHPYFASPWLVLAVFPMIWFHRDYSGLWEGVGVVAAVVVFISFVLVRPIRLFTWYPLRYCAYVSLPLYLFHRPLMEASFNTLPAPFRLLPGVVVCFVLAHLSTYYFEPLFRRSIAPQRDAGSRPDRSIMTTDASPSAETDDLPSRVANA